LQVIFISINYWQVCECFMNLGFRGCSLFFNGQLECLCSFAALLRGSNLLWKSPLSWEAVSLWLPSLLLWCAFLLLVCNMWLLIYLFFWHMNLTFPFLFDISIWLMKIIDAISSYSYSYMWTTSLFLLIFQSSCTILAMVATLPVVQLFFFHILLIKKVIICFLVEKYKFIS